MKIAMLSLLAALAVGGCAHPLPAGTSVAPAPLPPLARIEMETKSFWYALSAAGTDFVSAWQIDADGTGLFRSIEWKRVGDVFERSDVTRRFAAGRRGFRRVAALLRPAEQAATGGRIRCGDIPYTDSANGYVAWTRAGIRNRAEYDQGCPTAKARRIFANMDQAEKLVTAWGAKGQIVRSERLPDRP